MKKRIQWRWFIFIDGLAADIERHPIDAFRADDDAVWGRILCHCPTYERAVQQVETFYRTKLHDLKMCEGHFKRRTSRESVLAESKNKYGGSK